MITVAEAESIVLSRTRDFGVEETDFSCCLGRVLAEDIVSDRDLPPFNRVTMDGIAIRYEAIENGSKVFTLGGTQLAGDTPLELRDINGCIAIMTGAALPDWADTVIPVEQITMVDDKAIISQEAIIRRHQNIHFRGRDKSQGAVLVDRDRFITTGIVTIAAAVGKTKVLVHKKPRVVIISTGNELVDVHEKPSDFQIRRSNNYALDAALKRYGLQATILHLPDDRGVIEKEIAVSLNTFDVIILCGGVSMGTSDYVPTALEQSGVKKLFHKVKQRPGKPFWFGYHEAGATVFAFPGNPVSSFLCFHRYFLPWLLKCWSVVSQNSYAVLEEDVLFEPSMQYFLSVKLSYGEDGTLLAKPVTGNGSGDFVSLAEANAFMELPLDKKDFKQGEAYRIWMFN